MNARRPEAFGPLPSNVTTFFAPFRFRELAAEYERTQLPIRKAPGDPVLVKLSFDHIGLPVFTTVGIGLKLEDQALWITRNVYIGPALFWRRVTVPLEGIFDPKGVGMNRRIDVLKAVQWRGQPLNISGEGMLIADWDRDVYAVGEIPLPQSEGFPALFVEPSMRPEEVQLGVEGLPVLYAEPRTQPGPVDILEVVGSPVLFAEPKTLP